MLMHQHWNESKVDRVVLTEPVGCTDVFEDFLKYLYTGEVNLDIGTVMHILQLSDKYNVKVMLLVYFYCLYLT